MILGSTRGDRHPCHSLTEAVDEQFLQRRRNTKVTFLLFGLELSGLNGAGEGDLDGAHGHG